MKKLRLMLFLTCAFVGLFVEAEDKKAKNKTELVIPLGVLGGKGTITKDRADIAITEVMDVGLLKKSGFRIGDKIVAVNDKRFAVFTKITSDGGKGPMVDLGYALESGLKQSTKSLELTVMRSGKEIKRDIRLPDIKALSANFPFNCSRSLQMVDRIGAWMEANAAADASWGGSTNQRKHVTSTLCGLMLLSTGDRKYKKLLEKLAHRYVVSVEAMKSDHYPSWSLAFGGIFLGEYYLATGDGKVLAPLAKICKIQAEWTSEDGKHGHGKVVGYDGRGINIITSHIMICWALAHQCGVKIDQNAWDRCYKQCESASTTDGALKYNPGAGLDAGPARTSVYAVALDIFGGYTKRVKKGVDYIVSTHKELRECHAVSLLGGTVCGPGLLLSKDKVGYRTTMDYFRWYFALCTAAPKDKENVINYCPANTFSPSDKYMESTISSHAVIGLMLCSSRQKLFIQGGRKMNWYTGGHDVPIVTFYQKSNPVNIFDILSDKVESLRDLHELPHTLKFLKGKTKNPKAVELKAKILAEVGKDIDYLAKLLILKPVVVANRLNKLKRILGGHDEELVSKVDTVLMGTSSNEGRTLAKFYIDFDNMKNPRRKQFGRQKATKVKGLLRKVEKFLGSQKLTGELRFEAALFSDTLRQYTENLASLK